MRFTSKTALMALVTVLLLPLIPMALIPFYDTSEPRYADIARVMVESGDWITPWFSPGVPFWGKPPLSFWAQALSMKAFGFTEFAGRLPSWICLLLSVAILLRGLRPIYGIRVALLSALIYSTCTLVYMSSGAVLTDPFLALGTTLSVVAFAVIVGSNRAPEPTDSGEAADAPDPVAERRLFWWRYGFFIGLAVGLLSKGPLALVLVAVPVALWYAVNFARGGVRPSLPWIKGFILVAVLTLPWYVMAELKTPGFLDYFIVGEHFRRFLDPGWKGDMYGTAHRETFGKVWLFWVLATFPWGVLAVASAVGALFSPRLRLAVQSTAHAPLFLYWLAAAAATPLFFTFSANILWTYVLPSVAGFSVVAALLADRMEMRLQFSARPLLIAAGLVPTVALVLGVVAWAQPDLRNTERSLVQYAQRLDGDTRGLFYLWEMPFSARFYSNGTARRIGDTELKSAAACGRPFYLAIPRNAQAQVSGMLDLSLTPLYTNKRYMLLKIAPTEACSPGAPGHADAATPVASQPTSPALPVRL